MSVTIFTKTGCPHCAGAKKDLQKKGVKFEEINISQNPGKINELMRLTGLL